MPSQLESNLLINARTPMAASCWSVILGRESVILQAGYADHTGLLFSTCNLRLNHMLEDQLLNLVSMLAGCLSVFFNTIDLASSKELYKVFSKNHEGGGYMSYSAAVIGKITKLRRDVIEGRTDDILLRRKVGNMLCWKGGSMKWGLIGGILSF
ncbi:hypothetical protein CFP56_025084 [Quercus suber]|uniref:Uncharacterized protein n=1 Tax=Quercus suber TaxID=58331 RepID=A0AAW0K7Y8_QUESU